MAANASPVEPADGLIAATSASTSGLGGAGARTGAAVGTNSPSVRLVEVRYASATRCTSAAVIVRRRSRYANRSRQSPIAAHSDSSIATWLESAKPSANAFSALAR